jgi:aminoglycoside 2''-phosphotransferase
MVNQKFKNSALLALKQITNIEEELKELYVQPDRAIYLAPNQKLIFKVYSEGSVLKKEADMLIKAREVKVLVPKVIALIEEEPTVLVMEAIEGSPLTEKSVDAAREFGEYIERFHNLEAHPPFSNGQMTWDSFVITWANKELSELKTMNIFAEYEVYWLINHFSSFKEILKTRPIKFLHGDLQPAHILVNTETDKVTGIIDFADTQPGDPLMDIAVLSLWDTELASLVLAGYKSIENNETTQSLIELYRLLRKIGEIPWLLKRDFKERAQRDIDSIKETLEIKTLTN